MKKLFVLLFTLLLISATVIGLTACETVDPVCQHTDSDSDGVCDECGGNLEDDSDLPEDHVHKFENMVAEEKYLAKAGDCKNAAKYYYSCSCGKKGELSFSFGDPVHVYDNEVISKKYFAAEANCQSGKTYYYSCTCGKMGKETFAFGDPTPHSITERIADEKFLAKAADCYGPALYYFSCVCGKTANTVFEEIGGKPAPHTYTQKNTSEKYLVSAANCQSGALYLYSCTCGAPGADTFTVGQSGAHNYTEKYAEEEYLADAGNCSTAPSYYYSCVCGKKGTETYTCGKATHSCTLKNTDPKYLKSAATETHPAMYYYSCACGYASSITFTHGYSLGYKLLFELSSDKSYYAVDGYVGETEEIVVPESYNGLPVEAIGVSAFVYNKSVKRIILPSSIKAIGRYAFSGCNSLEAVNLPEGLTRIESGAFGSCEALKEIAIPSSVIEIDEGQFDGCKSLAKITVGNGNTAFKVVDGALYTADGKTLIAYAKGSSNTELTVLDGVTKIGKYAFSDCAALKSVILPESVKTIDEYAFYRCTGLTYVNLEGITSLGNFAFSECSGLQSITLPTDIAVIGSAFSKCSGITSVTLPEGITNISLEGWSSLKSLHIPQSVKGINIKDCKSLESITVDQGNAVYVSVDDVLYSNKRDTLIRYAPKKAGKSFSVPKGVKTISSDAFADCLYLEEITVGNDVTLIKNNAFKNCTSLKLAVIENNVTTISTSSFYGCTKLTRIVLPFIGISEVEDIYKTYARFGYIFNGSLDSDFRVSVPPSVKTVIITGGATISNNAFRGCEHIENIVLPSTANDMGYGVFESCKSLKYVYLPVSVSFLSSDTFRGCSSLKELNIQRHVRGTSLSNLDLSWCASLERITVDKENTAYADIDGVLYTKDGTELVAYPSGKVGESFTVPSSVRKITSSYAFRNNQHLRQITVSEGVTEIWSQAFRGCKALEYVTLPKSLTVLGDWAFMDCENLKSINLPAGITEFRRGMLSGCTSLTELRIEDGSPFKLVNGSLYSKDGKTLIMYNPASKEDSFTIPEGVEVIEEGAFYSCEYIKKIIPPVSLKKIKDRAFYGSTSITGVYVTDLSAWCAVDIGNNDDYSPFDEVNLYVNGELVTDLVIPEGVTTIGRSAFGYFKGIKSVSIPSSVNMVSASAFANCTNLTDVYIADLSAWCSARVVNAFPDPSLYNASFYFNGVLATDIVIPEEVTSIGAYTFRGFKGIKSIVIHDNVKTIGNGAFEGIKGLESLTISTNSMVKDGDFYHIGFLFGATEWSYGGMSVPSTLKTVTVTGNSEIPSYAFRNCRVITEIIIEEGVTSIGSSAFEECASLVSITIPGTVKVINSRAFNYCSKLESVIIENGVTEISRESFLRCEKLKTIVIPASVTRIDSKIFGHSVSLESIKYAGTKEMWDAIEKNASWNSVYVDGEYVPTDCEITYNYTVE